MSVRRLSIPGIAAILLAGCALPSAAQEVAARADHKDGLYAAGEKVKWTLTLKDGDLLKGSVKYRIKTGGWVVASEGAVSFKDGQAELSADLPSPGWTLLEVEYAGPDGKAKIARSSALASPEKIVRSAPRPADFDSFWNSKIAELRRTKITAVETPVSIGRDDLSYSLVTLNGWKGAKINGQLVKPAKPGRFPALLVVQWAGVYKLDKNWILGHGANGWLTLDIQAHELPVDGTDEFFKQQSDGPLKNYPSIGAESRETSYFLRMYLSCVRAADYLASRPDWDGKVMVVTGGSQGGLQSFVTAALHEKITGVLACVPAGCDQTGVSVGRQPGWPFWNWIADGGKKEEIMATAPYFDVVNFAPRIHVPMLVGVGGIDTVCPACGIYAALNQIRSRKEVVYMPLADHSGDHAAYYQRYGVWQEAFKEGRRP